jgi:hypothetical protein
MLKIKQVERPKKIAVCPSNFDELRDRATGRRRAMLLDAFLNPCGELLLHQLCKKYSPIIRYTRSEIEKKTVKIRKLNGFCTENTYSKTTKPCNAALKQLKLYLENAERWSLKKCKKKRIRRSRFRRMS